MAHLNLLKIEWTIDTPGRKYPATHSREFAGNEYQYACGNWADFVYNLTNLTRQVEEVIIDGTVVWRHGKWIDTFICMKMMSCKDDRIIKKGPKPLS